MKKCNIFLKHFFLFVKNIIFRPLITYISNIVFVPTAKKLFFTDPNFFFIYRINNDDFRFVNSKY